MNEINDYEDLGDVELPEEQANIYNKLIEDLRNHLYCNIIFISPIIKIIYKPI